MEPIILFRKSRETDEEEKVARQYFPETTNSRVDCHNSLVIGRYSCLPFYRELEVDLLLNGCRLINSFTQHSWIANFDYYFDLKNEVDTPESWTQDNFWTAPEGKFVVKGATNSRKHAWKTSMFAENKKEAIRIAHELQQDSLIGNQRIIFRRYVPLKIYETGICGMPFANEWRCFFLGKELLTVGYYWSVAEDSTIENALLTGTALDFAKKTAKLASEYTNFFVLDIAEKADGGWTLIEINDAQQSGLSENNPHTLYKKLKNNLKTGEWK